jgi:hypothetical protein
MQEQVDVNTTDKSAIRTKRIRIGWCGRLTTAVQQCEVRVSAAKPLL